MTTVQAIIQHLESLPDSVQREVLDFVEFLEFRRKETSLGKEDVAVEKVLFPLPQIPSLLLELLPLMLAADLIHALISL